MATRDGVASAAQREVRGWSTGDDGFELFEGAVEGFGGVSDAHDTEMMNLNLGVGMNVNIKHTTSAKSSSRDGASPSTDKGKGSRGGSDGSKRGGGSGRGKDGDAAARAQSPVSAEAQRLRIEREKEGMSRIGNNKSMQRERWRFHHRVAAVLKDIWQSLQKLGRGQRDMSKSHYIQVSQRRTSARVSSLYATAVRPTQPSNVPTTPPTTTTTTTTINSTVPPRPDAPGGAAGGE